jgi:phage-related protein (TIGR01555 family)
MATGTTSINAEQLAIFSELLKERLAFGRQHGLMYEGDRDIYAVAGYPRELTYAAFYSVYERSGIAGQVVDMPAETTWRKTAEITEPDQKDGTELTKQWAELAKRLGVWQRLERADRLARIGRYSVLLIGAAATDDRALAEPLPRLSGPDDVLYLSAFGEGHATIKTWVTDPRDARFGLPETYEIDLSSGVSTFQSSRGAGNKVIVHHSRVIHIAEGLLSDEVYGRPALQRIYNDLHDLQKVSASTAEAFWQVIAGILTANIDPAASVSDEQLKSLDDSLQKLYHDLKRTFFGKGIELSRLAGDTPDPKAAADLYMTMIAAGAGIPKRLLFGSETGERASSEDAKTFLGSIAERQQQHAEPAILRPFIDRLIEHGALPRPGTRDGYNVVWAPLFEESAKDIAEANRSRAETARALTPVGGSPLDLVEVDEERNVKLRPTGERGELKPAELEPPDPMLPAPDDEEDEDPGAREAA